MSSWSEVTNSRGRRNTRKSNSAASSSNSMASQSNQSNNRNVSWSDKASRPPTNQPASRVVSRPTSLPTSIPDSELKCTISLNNKRQMTSNCLVMIDAKGVPGNPTGQDLKQAIDNAFSRYCGFNNSKICAVSGTVITVEGEEVTTVPVRRPMIDRSGDRPVVFTVPIYPLKNDKYDYHVREYFTYHGKTVPWFFVWTSHPALTNLLCGKDEKGLDGDNENAGPVLFDELPDGTELMGIKLNGRIIKGKSNTYTDAISPNPSNKIAVKLSDRNRGLSLTGQSNYMDMIYDELSSFAGKGEEVTMDRREEANGDVFAIFAIEPENARLLHDSQLRMSMFVWFNNNLIFTDNNRELKMPMYYLGN